MRWLAMAVVAGCAGRAPEPVVERPAPKTALAEPSSWADGPEVAATAELRAWLDGLPPEAVVALPVTLERDETGSRTAWIGAREDGLHVRPDDLGLGISLDERVRQHCPEGGLCVLWLEGHWGATTLPGLSGDDGAVPFQLRRVVGPVTGTESLRARSGRL